MDWESLLVLRSWMVDLPSTTSSLCPTMFPKCPDFSFIDLISCHHCVCRWHLYVICRSFALTVPSHYRLLLSKASSARGQMITETAPTRSKCRPSPTGPVGN